MSLILHFPWIMDPTLVSFPQTINSVGKLRGGNARETKVERKCPDFLSTSVSRFQPEPISHGTPSSDCS